MFRVMVLRGAVLALSMGGWACSGNSSSNNDSGSSNDSGQAQNQDSGSGSPDSGSGMDAGQTPDSGQSQDAGPGNDGGACTCVPDPTYHGFSDCTPPGGGTAVCCWLGINPPCCP